MRDEDDDYQFALDEVGPDAGPPSIEPGSPTAENIAFVLLGAVGTILAIVQLVRPFA